MSKYEIQTSVILRAVRNTTADRRWYLRQLRKVARSLVRCGGDAALHGRGIAKSARRLQAAL